MQFVIADIDALPQHFEVLAHAVIHAFGTAIVLALIGGGVLIAVFWLLQV